MVRVNIDKRRRLKTGKLGGEGALADKAVQRRGDGRYLALMWATARCPGGWRESRGGEGAQAALPGPVDTVRTGLQRQDGEQKRDLIIQARAFCLLC